MTDALPMTHTPGPWEFDREITYVNQPGEQEQHGHFIVFAALSEDIAIAEVIAESDARLIIASPDLLAAAKDALAVAGAGLHLAGENMEALRRAIRKATGAS